MINPAKFIFIVTMLFTQPLYAASVEEYLQACSNRYGVVYGQEFCQCMLTKSKDLSDEEFDFHYAYIAGDKERVSNSLVDLDVNQKNKVIRINIFGPSECNAERTATNKSSNNASAAQ